MLRVEQHSTYWSGVQAGDFDRKRIQHVVASLDPAKVKVLQYAYPMVEQRMVHLERLALAIVR